MAHKLPVILAAFTLLTSALYAQHELAMLTPELVRTEPLGDKTGQLSYRALGAGAGNLGPTDLAYRDGTLYLPDTSNQRINMYDLDWNPMGSLFFPNTDMSQINLSESIRFFDNGDLLSWTRSGNLLRVHRAGGIAFTVTPDDSDAFTTGQFWTWRDYVLYYDRAGRPCAIASSGQALSGTHMASLLQTTKQGSRLRKQSSKLRTAIDDFLERNNLMLAGDALLTWNWDSRKTTEFFRLLADSAPNPDNVLANPSTVVAPLRAAVYGPEIGLYHVYRDLNDKVGYYAIIRYNGVVVKRFELNISHRAALTANGVLTIGGDVYGYDIDAQHRPIVFDFYRLHAEW